MNKEEHTGSAANLVGAVKREYAANIGPWLVSRIAGEAVVRILGIAAQRRLRDAAHGSAITCNWSTRWIVAMDTHSSPSQQCRGKGLKWTQYGVV
jgi:hypothetical protein